MSRGYNHSVIMGNLARDPDIRYTSTKQPVARFTVAVGRTWKDKQTGERKEQADFIPCTAFGYTADNVSRYLHKGSPVLCEGRISVRDYDDAKTGKHVWKTELCVENVVFVGNKGGDAQADDNSAPNEQSAPENIPDEFPLDFSAVNSDNAGNDADIPF